jgi:serine/threonine protein kinase
LKTTALARPVVNQQEPDVTAVPSPRRRNLSHDDLEPVERLGAGGQGVVYEARVPDDEPPDRIALKEPLLGGTVTPEVVEGFRAEAETWTTVDAREREKPRWRNSEHVVGVVDHGDAPRPWLAVEYMDGGSLADRLADRPGGLPLAEALWVGECVCRAMAVAHEYGIVHLDLKPANVLFRSVEGAWDVPKVADWGLARVLAEQTGSVESLTVDYAAPEQFEPDEFGDPDSLTDVYQVGALVYALVTGDPPYTGSQLGVIRDVLEDTRPDPPSSRREAATERLDAVVLRALEREKADRYQAIQTFEAELAALREGAVQETGGSSRTGRRAAGEDRAGQSPDAEGPDQSEAEGGAGRSGDRGHPPEQPGSERPPAPAADDASGATVDDASGATVDDGAPGPSTGSTTEEPTDGQAHGPFTGSTGAQGGDGLADALRRVHDRGAPTLREAVERAEGSDEDDLAAGVRRAHRQGATGRGSLRAAVERVADTR